MASATRVGQPTGSTKKKRSRRDAELSVAEQWAKMSPEERRKMGPRTSEIAFIASTSGIKRKKK